MRRPRRPARELRTAIDCMPLDTRRAMRDAIGVNPIIVGAYTDREGGICPMLAAHRNGGRTSFASFARAWDRYTRAGSGSRPATEREVRTLTAMLDTSIASDDAREALGEAIAEHHETQARRARLEEHDEASRAPEPRRAVESVPTGERDRTAELRARSGWAWLRPVRRLDDYERALAALEEGHRDSDAEREREPVA